MNDIPTNNATSLAGKITRLVEESGWNMEEFARRKESGQSGCCPHSGQ